MDLLTYSPKETHAPWNKGNLIGQKAPLKPKDIWAIRIHLKMATALATSPSSTWPSTVSCAVVTSSNYETATSRTVITSPVAQPSCSRRPSSRCTSKSPTKRRTW